MGQQQVILVILVTIIVGVATLVSVNVLNQRQIQSNRDAVSQDLSASASFIQSLWEKPELLGGASRNFNNMTEEEILRFLNVPSSGYQPGDSEASNENGTYTVEIISNNEIVITGEPASGPPNIQISVTRNESTGQWNYEFSIQATN